MVLVLFRSFSVPHGQEIMYAMCACNFTICLLNYRILNLLHSARNLISQKSKTTTTEDRTFTFQHKGPFKYYVSMFLENFLTHPHTFCVLLVSKNGQFLNPTTQSSAYVIFEWSLSTYLLHLHKVLRKYNCLH